MQDEDRYELVRGRLVERKSGAVSDRVTTRILSRLDRYVEAMNLGTVLGSETGYRCVPKDPKRVRKPAVSFIAGSRLREAELPEGYMEIAPDPAMESVSPYDLLHERKGEECLAADVRLVWVAGARQRTAIIYCRDGSGTRPRGADATT